MPDRPFSLFFGGAEEPGWRRRLIESGAGGIALSFRHLARRLPKTKPWSLAEQAPGVSVFLDSAAYNAKEESERQHNVGQWERYQQFVVDNLDAITLVTEFDDLSLWDKAGIEAQRDEFWVEAGERFVPVWHEEYGLKDLEATAERYKNVGVPHSAVSPQVVAHVGRLRKQYGTHFHAMGEADPDVLRHFDSASTHAWLSAMKYGETLVWDGNRLRRYPSKMKDQARRRHRTLIERAGFDADAIARDNGEEVARFTIWSLLRLEEHLGGRRVTQLAVQGNGSSVELAHQAVAPPPPQVRNSREALPVFVMTDQDGQRLPALGDAVMRRCSTCHVAGTCPAFEPESECAFDIPVEIKTKEQLLGLLQGVMAMQAQRVAFARYAEELEGGYPDANLSIELDRLMRVIYQAKQIQDDRDFLDIRVQAHAGAGVMSRLFGEKQAEPLQTLTRQLGPAETDHIIATVIEDTESCNTNGQGEGWKST